MATRGSPAKRSAPSALSSPEKKLRRDQVVPASGVLVVDGTSSASASSVLRRLDADFSAKPSHFFGSLPLAVVGTSFGICLKRATLLVETKQTVNNCVDQVLRTGGRGRSTALSDQYAWRSQQGLRCPRMFPITRSTEWLGPKPLRHRRAVNPHKGPALEQALRFYWSFHDGTGDVARSLGRFFGPCRKATRVQQVKFVLPRWTRRFTRKGRGPKRMLPSSTSDRDVYFC